MADQKSRATAGGDKRLTHLLDLTAQIISSHASSTSVASEQLPGLIDRVFGSLKALNLDEAPTPSAAPAKVASPQGNGDAKAPAAPVAATEAPKSAKPTASRRGKTPRAAPATKAPPRAKVKENAAVLPPKPRRASRTAPKAASVGVPAIAAPVKLEAKVPASVDAAPKPTRRRKATKVSSATVASAPAPTKRSSRAPKAETVSAPSSDKAPRKGRSATKASTPAAHAANAQTVATPASTSAPKTARTRKAKAEPAPAAAAPVDQPTRKPRGASKASGDAAPSTRKVRRGVLAFATTPPAAAITPSNTPSVAVTPKQARRKLSIVTKS